MVRAKGEGPRGGGGGGSWAPVARGGEGKAESRNTLLAGKEYKDGLQDIVKNTVVKQTDIDQKALQLLDTLQARGRAKEACQYLKQGVEGLSREHVTNWRAYLYTLLKGFDDAAYKAMKQTSEGRRRPRGDRVRGEGGVEEKKEKKSKPHSRLPLSDFKFNPDAPEFVPARWNQPWAPTTAQGFLAPPPAAAAAATAEETADKDMADAKAEEKDAAGEEEAKKDTAETPDAKGEGELTKVDAKEEAVTDTAANN